MAVDLHSHTTASDGRLSPRQLVAAASAIGLRVLAITDHDTIDGITEARRTAPADLEILTGVELSCHVGDREAHILAYGFDPDEDRFRRALDDFRNRRWERARKIVDALNELDIEVTIEDIEAQADGGAIARPHIAQALVDRAHVESIDEAFGRYLGRRAAAFVDKPRMEPSALFELVHRAGGVAVIAHPGTFRRDDLIPALVEAGLDGIEVRHTEHSAAATRHFEQMARSMDLLMTGGSDFHGIPGHRSRLGAPAVPDAWFDDLVARLETRR